MTKAPVFQSALDTIGNTPLVRVNNIDTGPCELYLKLENQNPGGSIKDRIGKSMIEQAEKDGSLAPGQLIVEATAGNTGLGLAVVARQKGYPLLVVVPDKMAQEKIYHLRALGAEVMMTRSDVGKGHPDYYQDIACRVAAERGGWYVNQFSNPANPLAHETTTAPEIWQQMGGKLDAVVAGVGSGGTVTGLARFFARVSPATEIVVADPVGSIIAPYVNTGTIPNEVGSWIVEGIGEDFLPDVLDLSEVRTAYAVTDREALMCARELLNKEGIIAGSSSGTLLAAALRYCRAQTEKKRVVTLVCDSGNKYLSKMYNDYWMIDQGFIERPKTGDLRDLIARPHREHVTVTVGPRDAIHHAYRRMRLYDVSQVPVMEGDQIVGILDEEDILLKVGDDPRGFDAPVSAAMTSGLETIAPTASLAELKAVLGRGHVAIVKSGDEFLGLITRIDLLNHLRRRTREAA